MMHYLNMRVVEKDIHVNGMLNEELKRCRDMVISLRKELSNLPKGSLHTRQKRYKGKKYLYHYLKYREGGKSISKHVSQKELEELIQKLQARKRYEKEINAYMVRMKYLEKISNLR
jgi:hypothetical protein